MELGASLGNMDPMQVLMAGRDTRWYRGHLLRLTLICVSARDLFTSL